ncbi:MAG: SpoIIE family protein phosphatase [Magnetospirillum sp. WYHS-4]
MSIFKKLLVILLTVSLPPLVFISALDKRATEALSRELILDHRTAQIEQAKEELDRILRAASALIEAGRRETAADTDSLFDSVMLPADWTSTASLSLVEADSGRLAARRGPPEITGEALAAEGRAGSHPLILRVEVPTSVVLARTAISEQRARKRLAHQTTIAASSVVVFGLVAIILSYLGSRAVTRPVVELTETARRLADGDLKARADIRTGDELEQLGDSFNIMVPKLQDRFRMREALSLAMEVQQHLLPEASPSIPGFDIAGRSIYCDETGGDYYDFIQFSQLDDLHLGVAVGDVTGHGVAAALLMTTARALLRSHAATPGSLSELMTAINRHLSADTHAGRFMTLFYGVVEARNHRFRWVSAGHEPALLFSPESDGFVELAGSDIPLGIDGNWQYHEESRDAWRPGEIVTIGTDGIWESRNPRGEMFGKDALKSVIRKHAHLSADQICDAIARTLRSFRQDRAQEDDVTLVVIKAT